MRKSLLLFLALLILGSFFVSKFALAQEVSPAPRIEAPSVAPPTGISLTLSPVFLNLVTDPGKQVSSQFRVTNNNNFREYLEISVKKFIPSPSGDSPVIQDATNEDEFIDWVSFSEQQFTLDPNQTKTLRFSVNPPAAANLGYYYAFVVQRIGSTEKSGVGPAIAGSSALPVLLEVKSPNAKREIQIIDFKTDKLFYEYLPTNFVLTLKNSGNVHTAPSGDIFIDSMWNKEVGIVSANKGRGNILPNSTRSYTSAWDDGFAVKVAKTEDDKVIRNEKGELSYEVKYDFTKTNKFRFGRYTANLLLVYDNGERDVPLEAQVSFWVIPWKILGIGFVVLVLALIGLKSAVLNNVLKLLRR